MSYGAVISRTRNVLLRTRCSVCRRIMLVPPYVTTPVCRYCHEG